MTKFNPLPSFTSLVATGASLAAQKAEQKENREYNLRLAQMQNQWNVEQWQRENDYNSPTAQLKRIREAGLNPDLVYGGGIQNTAASSPNLTSGSPSSPIDWSPLGTSVQSALNAQLTQAQIDNINADTKNKGYEGSILASDAAFRDAFNSKELEAKGVRIRLDNTSGDLNEQHIKESQQNIRESEAYVEQMNATISQIFNAIKNDNARIELEKTFNEGNLKKMASECGLNWASAKSISDQLEKILRQYDDKHTLDGAQYIYLMNETLIQENRSVQISADTEKSRAETARIRIENGRAEFDAWMNGPDLFSPKYGIINAGLHFVNRVCRTLIPNFQ